MGIIGACDGVYEPREDSFLLEESVLKYAKGRVLDIGTGSGIQGIAAALNGCKVTFSDINEKALDCAKANAAANGVAGDFIRSDMFNSISGRFDTIAFNPPYLVSDGEADLAGRDASLEGGPSGRDLIDRFLQGYREHLKIGGTALLLESSVNGYERDAGIRGASIVGRKKFFFEELVVIRIHDEGGVDGLGYSGH